MNRLAQSLLLAFLVIPTVMYAGYRECAVLTLAGGYNGASSPYDAGPSASGFQTAYRSDLPSGPWPDEQIATNVYETLLAWYPFPTNTYPGFQSKTQVTFSAVSTYVASNLNAEGSAGSYWTNVAQGSMWFDGVDDYLSNNNTWNVTFGAGTNLSVSFWLYPERVSGGTIDTFWGVYPGVAAYYQFLYYTNSLIVQYADNSGNMTYMEIPVDNGQQNKWQHFAFVKDGPTRKTYIYTNAILAKTGTCAVVAAMGVSGMFMIGAREIGSAPYYQIPYKGGIGEYAVTTNIAWSGSTVTSIFNSGAAKHSRSGL